MESQTAVAHLGIADWEQGKTRIFNRRLGAGENQDFCKEKRAKTLMIVFALRYNFFLESRENYWSATHKKNLGLDLLWGSKCRRHSAFLSKAQEIAVKVVLPRPQQRILRELLTYDQWPP